MLQSEDLVFGDVVLDRSCLFAHRDGRKIRFTRSERALLLVLSRKPHSLMPRTQLLDAIASTDADISDRNVDYLINRLRAKLGDSARAPRYIATQYGEGYVWIAEPPPLERTRPELATAGGLLAIVPVGVGQDARLHDRADVLIGRIRELIAGDVGSDQAVVVVGNERDAGTRYLLALSFREGEGHLGCSVTLREVGTRRILHALRAEFESVDATATELQRAANDVMAALRRHLAEASEGLGTPIDQPLEVRFRKATTLLSASNPEWLEKGLQLRAAREESPDNADIALQWCLHLFSRLVLTSPFTGISARERDELEGEIEATALECLPRIESNPLLMLAAAKLLYFVDRGHLDLAEDLAERAFARTADFAAALPILGQLRQARGDFSGALAFFNRGIEMTEGGSEFDTHMRVLKCIALLAVGDREALKAETAAHDSPHAPADLSAMVAAMVTPPEEPLPQVVRNVLAAAGPDGARNAIAFTYMTSVRHLISRQARANIMQGLLTHLTGLHGQDIVPSFVLSGTGLAASA